MPPSVVISLDFELRWGVLDRVRDDFSAYRANLEGVPEAVDRMLDLFDEHEVRATWAIVGSLACTGWDEWEERRPDLARLRTRPPFDGMTGSAVVRLTRRCTSHPTWSRRSDRAATSSAPTPSPTST